MNITAAGRQCRTAHRREGCGFVDRSARGGRPVLPRPGSAAALRREPGAGSPGRTGAGGAGAADRAALVVRRRSEHHPDPVPPAPAPTHPRPHRPAGRPVALPEAGPDRLHLLARCRVDPIEPGIPPRVGTSALRRSENLADEKQKEPPNPALPSITQTEETIVTTTTAQQGQRTAPQRGPAAPTRPQTSPTPLRPPGTPTGRTCPRRPARPPNRPEHGTVTRKPAPNGG